MTNNIKVIGILNCDTDSGEDWIHNVTPMTIGVLAEELDLQEKLSFRIFDAHRSIFPDRHEHLDGIIITGGATNILTYQPDSDSWVTELRHYLENALRTNTPVLGVCFGSQAITAVFGGEVRPIGNDNDGNVIYERGFREINLTEEGRTSPIFESFPQVFCAAESHRNRVTRLPEGAALLAQNDFGIQAYSLIDGARRIYAVQFHPEIYGPALVRSLQRHGHAELVEKTKAKYARSNGNFARRVYHNWARNVVLPATQR